MFGIIGVLFSLVEFVWKSLHTSGLLSMLRLYVQQGLSNRVSQILTRAIGKSDVGETPGEETRDRSRVSCSIGARRWYWSLMEQYQVVMVETLEAMPHGGSGIPATPQ